MKAVWCARILCAVSVGVLAVVASTKPGVAATFEILHQFRGGPNDGSSPQSQLVVSEDGRTLYGTTYNGGTDAGGTIFSLTREENGTWRKTIHHSFESPNNPFAGLVAWGQKFYGTTTSYGEFANGSVFMFDPSNNSVRIILDLNVNPERTGSIPQARLHVKNGRLYGAAAQGGAGGGGTIFSLSRPANLRDPWPVTIIHRFNGRNGFNAAPGFTITGDGEIYGNTYTGHATTSDGVAYGLTPVDVDANEWTSTILHRFSQNSDGYQPYGELVEDGGALYGTTNRSTGNGPGTIFRLLRKNGVWQRETLVEFPGVTNGPRYMYSGLVKDSQGNFYGASNEGGAFNFGTVFRLSRPAKVGGRWRLAVLHHFRQHDGRIPAAPPAVYEANGQVILYGTTTDGGRNNHGTIYRIVLP